MITEERTLTILWQQAGMVFSVAEWEQFMLWIQSDFKALKVGRVKAKYLSLNVFSLLFFFFFFLNQSIFQINDKHLKRAYFNKVKK